MKQGDRIYRTFNSSSLMIILIWLQLITINQANAQQYDILLKGGTVIDPKNNMNSLSDLAIVNGKIVKIETNIPAKNAKKVIDVTGLYVVPGLIDNHSHLFAGTVLGAHANGEYSVFPDGFTFRTGTTTIVDCGSSGWRNFKQFYEGVIAISHTRVLVRLNIVGLGLSGQELSQNVADMNPEMTAKIAKEYPGIIVGIKTVQWQGKEWTNVERAIEAGRLADLPVMVDFGKFWPEDRPYQELVLKKLRPGDISTHMYKREVPLFDENGKLLPYLAEARKRGVFFDIGHGLGNFNFPIVVPAIKAGWWPDAISTDLHAEDVNHAMKDLNNVMSKIMNMGISLQDIIKMTTWNPAQMCKRPDLGHLSADAVADVAVLRIVKGNFGWLDITNTRMTGAEKIECELTIKGGEVVWDLNGIAAKEDYKMIFK
ncbi:MAG TPA: amidohydrolase/deacetylase family metallohydrolase [Bacteroidales bacterium]|nr:amidohydrolase/deacetylase family metallohydrolase [Bacteroidales bacterium]